MPGPLARLRAAPAGLLPARGRRHHDPHEHRPEHPRQHWPVLRHAHEQQHERRHEDAGVHGAVAPLAHQTPQTRVRTPCCRTCRHAQQHGPPAHCSAKALAGYRARHLTPERKDAMTRKLWKVGTNSGNNGCPTLYTSRPATTSSKATASPTRTNSTSSTT
ncbi:hypothetical protein SGPA1_30952 [Streptomyces misionensis JCM 4497]